MTETKTPLELADLELARYDADIAKLTESNNFAVADFNLQLAQKNNQKAVVEARKAKLEENQ